MASDELAAKLQRRNVFIEKAEEGEELPPAELPSNQIWNPFTEFKEFSRKQIQNYQTMFKKYDIDKDKFINLPELKYMMEKLEAPQTHLALKSMIEQVDEDEDDKISFREFLLIFRKAAAGELTEDSGLYTIFTQMTEIDVDKEGVKGAKNFFEAKIDQQTQSNKFEQEIKDEQELIKQEKEEQKVRRAAFKEKATFFANA